MLRDPSRFVEAMWTRSSHLHTDQRRPQGRTNKSNRLQHLTACTKPFKNSFKNSPFKNSLASPGASIDAAWPRARRSPVPNCAGRGYSRSGSRPDPSCAQPRAAGRGGRPIRSGRRRRRHSPSCAGRLADRRGEGYRRSWRAWRFRCSERMTHGQPIPTRWQLLALSLPPQNQNRHGYAS